MENSRISWTDHTFNPWIGCTRVSPGCENCYAETQDHRWGHDRWGVGKKRTLTKKANWDKVRNWNKAAQDGGRRFKVFCASMSDVFDPEVPDEWRTELFKLIVATPHLDWLLLTKRTKLMREYMEKHFPTPLPNVWAGTTAEDQPRLNERLEDLLSTPAVIHWLSVEPQLGPIDLHLSSYFKRPTGIFPWGVERIDWIISGGESGHGAREFNVDWARDLRDQCGELGIAFFMKQLGQRPYSKTKDDIFSYWLIEGSRPGEWLARNNGKWDIPEEWPKDIQIQQFPMVKKALDLK